MPKQSIHNSAYLMLIICYANLIFEDILFIYFLCIIGVNKISLYRSSQNMYWRLSLLRSPQPGPLYLTITKLNATFASLAWSPPLDLGGRLDLFYEIQCRKCEKVDIGCNEDCTGSVINHKNVTGTMANVQRLSPFTSYKLRVVSKNGISLIAEMKYDREPSYEEISFTTSETGTFMTTMENDLSCQFPSLPSVWKADA